MTNKKFINCPECGSVINQKYGRGLAVKYCSDICKQTGQEKKKKEKVFPRCTVEGCDMDATRLNMYCEKHYMRLRRKGHTKLKEPKLWINHSAGYVIEHNLDHPLSKGGNVYKHRMVYYNAHGEGPFNCYWCNDDVTWASMHIDHLDANKKNNKLYNLVASCPRCNMKRARHNLLKTMDKKYGVELNGKKQSLSAWARELGISSASISYRLKSGWPLERALTEKRGKTGPRSSNGLFTGLM